MSPGERLPADRTEEPGNPTEGSASLKAAQETLATRDPVSGGNAIPAGLISTQPQAAAASPVEAAGTQTATSDLQKPACPRCGLPVSDQGASSARRPGPSLQEGSSSSRRSSSRRKKKRSGARSNEAGAQQPAATTADSCLRLLLACLSCQASALLLALLEGCAGCCLLLCPACCHGCSQCCAALQDAPLEEAGCHAHCHSVLFQSCCEPVECLEFCLECCELCHRT